MRRLIADHIHSVEQLEVLLLLRREADREWSPGDVASELVTTLDSVAARLEDLAERGFAVKVADDPPRYRWSGDGARDGLVDELASLYARRRVSVISEIFSRPSETIRTFADAFRLRGGG